MVEGVQVRVNGLAQLKRNFRAMPKKLREKHLHSAVLKGARVIRKEARKQAPKDSKRMMRAIINPKAPGATSWSVEYDVLVRSKSRADPKSAFYWYFVEFGTTKMAARPFMRRAFMNSRREAEAEISKRLRLGVIETANSLPKRQFFGL